MAETNLVARPDRNLAMELVRATEAAAIRAVPFIGKGDKLAADGAAVDAMRAFLGTVEFDGWARWVKLQMSDTPAIRLVLGSIVAAVLGLCLSLFVRPRRVWARVQTNADGSRLVQIGGLDRADARAGLDTDVTDLATRISETDHNRGTRADES